MSERLGPQAIAASDMAVIAFLKSPTIIHASI